MNSSKLVEVEGALISLIESRRVALGMTKKELSIRSGMTQDGWTHLTSPNTGSRLLRISAFVLAAKTVGLSPGEALQDGIQQVLS